MFHVEQQQTHIKTKDFLVSKEEFVIAKTSDFGLLKTLLSPSKDKYTSITSPINIHLTILKRAQYLTLFIGHLETKFVFQKKHLNLNSCKNLLDFGSGDGFFIQSISESNIRVFGVEPVLPKKAAMFSSSFLMFKKRTSIQHYYGVAFLRTHTGHHQTSQALVDLLEKKEGWLWLSLTTNLMMRYFIRPFGPAMIHQDIYGILIKSYY